MGHVEDTAVEGGNRYMTAAVGIRWCAGCGSPGPDNTTCQPVVVWCPGEACSGGACSPVMCRVLIVSSCDDVGDIYLAGREETAQGRRRIERCAQAVMMHVGRQWGGLA